jgi:hypothetical protein
MTRIVMRIMSALAVVFAPLMVGCSSSPLDELLVNRDARDVKRYSETNTRQISYNVPLKYPAVAFTDTTFIELKKLGWSKCTGYQEGWNGFVDASKGEGQERTVFQNHSYWFKDGALLTIAMMYYSGTNNKRRLDAPDNAQQQVLVLENKNPGVKEKLGVNCSE